MSHIRVCRICRETKMMVFSWIRGASTLVTWESRPLPLSHFVFERLRSSGFESSLVKCNWQVFFLFQFIERPWSLSSAMRFNSPPPPQKIRKERHSVISSNRLSYWLLRLDDRRPGCEVLWLSGDVSMWPRCVVLSEQWLIVDYGDAEVRCWVKMELVCSWRCRLMVLDLLLG